MKTVANAMLAALLLSVSSVAIAEDDAISRAEAFALIWQSTSRPVEVTREPPYGDVRKGSVGYEEITYAKARGLLDDAQEFFYPSAPTTLSDALRWILRTRNVEPILENGTHALSRIVEAEDVPALASFYNVSYEVPSKILTREDLLDLMRHMDAALDAETHEVSLYSEKFHGKGTAFGETFDMNALTAAHRTFPHNTLVRVTNIANGKSVVVRINDRGPYVEGRDMDLSLRSFTEIAERSLGKIRVTFERLGDAESIQRCEDRRYQRRITRGILLRPGVPHSFAVGRTLSLTSDQPFVIRDIYYPDGKNVGIQTWVTDGEYYDFTPSVTGLYRFMVGTKAGRVREMRMEVVDCGMQ